MSTPSVRLIPLGGLGEIGMNCLAIACDDTIVVVDCGIGFTDDPELPPTMCADFQWLVDRAELVEAIVITHGHEDHIGALPHLLREFDAPVYALPYARALIEERLRSDHRDLDVALEPHTLDDVIEAGPFGVQRYRVHHSIPEATGLIIDTPVGTIVHSGDFKIETDPVAHQHFDRDRLVRVAEDGVRLLLSDSTNATVDGVAGDERGVRAALDTHIAQAEQRVIVAIFASNVFRLAHLFEAARNNGRRVCLLGRSVRKHVAIAQELGLIDDAHAVIVPPDQAQRLPPRELLVIATGTQGESQAALGRLSNQSHRHLQLLPGDRVILSSRVIPGNEEPVGEVIERLRALGIDVRDIDHDAALHVSGHAARDEQRALIDLVKPQGFVPVHGTPRHLEAHAELATACAVEQVLVATNGDVVEVTVDAIDIVDAVHTGRRLIEGARLRGGAA